MQIILNVVTWFLGLGEGLLVLFVLTILGLAFGVGFSKSVRGVITTAIGLIGLFLVVNLIVSALEPAVQAIATRFDVAKAVIDVNWADAGIAWGWPGVAGVVLAIIVVNALMVWLKMTKTILDRCLVLLAWFCARGYHLGADRQHSLGHFGRCRVSGDWQHVKRFDC